MNEATYRWWLDHFQRRWLGACPGSATMACYMGGHLTMAVPASRERSEEMIPRDGYDYPTTLRPLCEGAPNRGFSPLPPIIPLMSASEESP